MDRRTAPDFVFVLLLALLITVAVIAGAAGAVAQHQHQPSLHVAQHDHHTSPYAGQQHSEIPSLTAEELEGLQNAEGMGLARAAELNHYPGPKHVLELAAELGLSDAQRQEIEVIRASMHEAALELGERIIEAERLLNRRFAHGHIDEAVLREMTGETAELRGELRFVHLRAHLETKAVLTTEQIEAYDRLRGYAAPTAPRAPAAPAAPTVSTPTAAPSAPAAPAAPTAPSAPADPTDFPFPEGS